MLHIPLEHTEVILLCPIYKKLKLACCSSCGACPLDSYCGAGEWPLTRYLVTVTSSRLDVLNNSDQSEEDDGMEEDNTEDTEDGEWDDYSWDDYSSDSEQSDTEC